MAPSSLKAKPHAEVPLKAATLALIASTFLALVALARPEGAVACEGRSLTFEEAIRMSDGAIYAGRITRADYRAYAYDISMDVELVVRGDAIERLRRAEAGSFCDGIEAGQWGYMVRGVRDPEFPVGPDDLFFRVGKFYARKVLAAAGVPDTATAVVADRTINGRGSLDWVAAIGGAASFLVAHRTLRRGRPRRRMTSV